MCNRESQGYRLCGNCKKEWRERRLRAYELTVKEIGGRTHDNRKEFDKCLKKIEKSLI